MSLVTDWITDEMVEPLAAAICYGEFDLSLHSSPEARPAGGNAMDYWRQRVAESKKPEYRDMAKRLLARVALGGSRLMPKNPPEGVIDAYRGAEGILHHGTAARHYRAIYGALPPLWREGAIE